MSRSKVIFVIVEGPSDEAALGAIMNRIHAGSSVHVKVMHRDITSDSRVNPNNIVAEIGKAVNEYIKNYYLKRTDFAKVIHIIDTDGAFIPDDGVIFDAARKDPFYTETGIYTCSKTGIEERNHHKSANIRRLHSLPVVLKSIPYQAYYMSCNLDHALYGKLNSSDKEKASDAKAFAVTYQDDIPAFLKFISESEFSVTGDYAESWQYIMDGLHSLGRHTNLGICFKKPDK